MTSGRTRLLDAASELLVAQPAHEPSTRELYEAAGVAAPTLYHHFGTKEGLLDAVVEQAFGDYVQRKQGMLRTGDLIEDFGAGWNLHIEFGLANPTLYALMYSPARTSAAAATADAYLRVGLERMRDAGLLRVDVDTAVSMTTGMAIGCVTQLNRQHGSIDDPAAEATRAALIEQLTGQPPAATTPAQAARVLLRDLPKRSRTFSTAESALFGQWLLAIGEDESTAPTPEGNRP